MSRELRRPTDQEQATIASVYVARSKLESKRITVVGVGMGPERIEDKDGRWTTLLGLPVVTVGTNDRRSLVLLVNVEETAFGATAPTGAQSGEGSVE